MEKNAHEHCETCYKQYCNAYDTVCKTVKCEYGCSAHMHSCKMADHKNVCQKIKVPCINAGYGCPALLPREKLKCHLEVCPASVTMCTMEWNRSPIYSKSRLSWVPFFQPNPILIRGQLDVELTLRDQRVLQDLIRQRMKRGKTKVDKLRTNRDLTSTGRRKEVKRVSSTPADCEDRALSMALALSTLEENIRLKKLNNQTVTKALLMDNLAGVQPSRTEEDNPENSVEDSGYLSNRKTRLENLVIENYAKNAVELHSLGSFSENSQIRNQSPKKPVGENGFVPSPPDLPAGSFDQNLGLNVMIETLPKFQKQFPMYSIPCSQMFRRNEFGSHFKNVHSDIQGGLNGWMEHRCPLAHYGCTFVRYRILPYSQNGVVVFDQDVGSFGVQVNKSEIELRNNPLEKSKTLSFRQSGEKDHLSILPEELLERIANMLDGFSLCSFSRTCKRLREAARHVLETKGMVVLQWEKKIYRTGNWRWRVRQKKWFFSTAFTPVEKWIHSNTPCMAAHMQQCKYYDHYLASEKFCYVPTTEKNFHDNKGQ